MYKQAKFKNELLQVIIRTNDGVFIPFAPDNTDYQAYLAWVALGNVAEPADA
jgi:hypothetical protein